MTNKEKFLKLVSEDNSNTLEWAKNRSINKNNIIKRKKMSVKIMEKLDSLNCTKAGLAKKIGVTENEVAKWIKGEDTISHEDLKDFSKKSPSSRSVGGMNCVTKIKYFLIIFVD